MPPAQQQRGAPVQQQQHQVQHQQYSPEERNCLVMAYQQHRGTHNCFKKVTAIFSTKFPNTRVPIKCSIIKMWKKQQSKFTVHNLNSSVSPGDSHSGRKRTARSAHNIAAVKAVLDADAEKAADDPSINSCRRNVLGLNPSTWCRIANKDLQYHSYKLEQSHHLQPQDLPRRVSFAWHYINLSQADKNNVAYSDEATFSLDGEVNTQNIRRYAPRKEYGVDRGGKPEQFRHTKSKYPKKVMVFLGLHSSGQTFGLKMYQNQTIDGNEYWRLCRYECIPQLKQLNNPQGTLQGMTWQQDGAKVHRTRKVLAYFDGQFGDKMFAMDTIQGHDWPARSPDLNPLDYFCWGFLKSKVFTPKPNTMEELKNRIRQEVASLDPDMIKRACGDLKHRCRAVINSGGSFIE